MKKRSTKRTKMLLEHEAYLRSLGVKGKASKCGINNIPDYKTQANAKLSNNIAGNGSAKEKPKYTGTYIKGIAVSHKSNLIPITSGEQAKEVSRMRRG